jgi:hypothetical protein
MQLPSILTLMAALTAAGVNGADIFRTSGSSCSGTQIGCKGIQEGQCCLFSRTVRQLLFTLPADSRGFAFTDDNCEGGSVFFKTAVKGTFCRQFNVNSEFSPTSSSLSLSFSALQRRELRRADGPATRSQLRAMAS